MHTMTICIVALDPMNVAGLLSMQIATCPYYQHDDSCPHLARWPACLKLGDSFCAAAFDKQCCNMPLDHFDAP